MTTRAPYSCRKCGDRFVQSDKRNRHQASCTKVYCDAQICKSWHMGIVKALKNKEGSVLLFPIHDDKSKKQCMKSLSFARRME